MRPVTRIVRMPERPYLAPKPVGLRYLDKDDQGHTRICVRTTYRKTQEDTPPALLQRATASNIEG